MASRRPSRGRKPRPSLAGQVVPLWLGVYPLAVFWVFWARGGTGMSLPFLVYAAALLVGFIVALNYHFFYRHRPPMSVIKPMGLGSAAAVALPLLAAAVIALYAASTGLPLTPVPGFSPLDTPFGWLRMGSAFLLALSHQPVPPLPPAAAPAKLASWVSDLWPLGPGTWGAMGYGMSFGLAALGFSALRKEVFDPRQQPFGGTSWPALRALVGLYFGNALGFGLGLVLVMAAGLFPGLGGVFGAGPGAMHAFAMGFSTGGLLLAASALFMGKADFTAAFSDPKSERADPPMKVTIPPIPVSEPPVFDFSAIGIETNTMLSRFTRDLNDLMQGLGLNEFSPAEVPAGGAPAAGTEGRGSKAAREIPTTNLISARQPDFDLSFDTAMGQLSNIYVQVSAELGSIDFSLAEWLSLTEGSLLELPRQPDNQVALCINHQPVGQAKPVVVGNHVAVKVLKLAPDALKQAQERR